MKTWSVMLLVCAVACGKQESSGGGGSGGSGATGASAAAPIDLPAVTHKSMRGGEERMVVFQGGKLVEVDRAEVYGSNPERPFRGFDPQGRLAPESGTWRPPAAAAPPTAYTVVLVDRGAKAAEVRAALAPLADRCVGFLGKRERSLAELIPDPCPPRPIADADHVQLGVLVDKGRIAVAISKIGERVEVADRAKLVEALRTHKASAFFADRKDIEIAFPKDATMGEVIELLDVVYGVGFTSPHWVDAAELAWVDQPAGEPSGASGSAGSAAPSKSAPVTMSIGQANVQGNLDKAIIRRYVKRHAQQLQACYEKQLAAKPALAGTVVMQFLIDRSGKVASASGAGLDPTVATCAADEIRTIVFPKPKGGNVQVSYPITFRPAGT